MAKTPPAEAPSAPEPVVPAATAVAVPAPEPVITLALDAFCARLSETVKRVELIAAFAHAERKAGNVKDTAAAYRARFDLFINKPV